MQVYTDTSLYDYFHPHTLSISWCCITSLWVHTAMQYAPINKNQNLNFILRPHQDRNLRLFQRAVPQR